MLIPFFFALPHSDAWSDTSIPVGSRPRNAAMISHEPSGPTAGSGISNRKKRPIAAIGAGSATYTASVDSTRMAARIFAASSTALYRPLRMMPTETSASTSPYSVSAPTLTPRTLTSAGRPSTSVPT